MKKCLAGILIFFLTISMAEAFDGKAIKPTLKDKCPVCGMFVAKYTDFMAIIVFKDGSYAAFDGVKDMIRCYDNLRKYLPGKSRSDIHAVFVTDYYNLRLVDAAKAYYVIGSNLYGPMGKELIPHETEMAAKEFLNDHKGKAILHFQEITDKILRELE